MSRFAATFSRIGFASVTALATVGACTSFRTEPPAGSGAPDASPSPVALDQATPDAVAPASPLKPVTGDLPKVDYHGVSAVSPTRVFIVGDEMLLDWDGKDWNVTRSGGTTFYGVYADADSAYAVGTRKNTNTGVMYYQAKTTARWIELATVAHGLHAMWGSGQSRVAAGNDGAIYYGQEPQPFKSAIQVDKFAGVPDTLFSPQIGGVGGNSPNRVVAAAGPGGWAGFDGVQWKAFGHPDPSISFRSVWGPPGDHLDVIIGGNYYSLWGFRGARNDAGERIPTSLLSQERDDVLDGAHFINGIWGESTRHFVAVGSSGRVMVFTQGELPNIIATSAGARDLWGVSGTDFADVWVVGDDGLILHGSL